MTKTLTAAVVAVMACLAMFATPASALTYEVTSCQSTRGVLNSASAWQYTGILGAPPALSVTDRCSATGTDFFGATDVLAIGDPGVVSARWRFAAPSDTQITRLQIDRRLYVGAQSGWTISGTTNNGAISGELCTGVTGSADCTSDRAVDLPLTGAVSSLTYTLECNIAPRACVGGFSLHATELRVRSATVTIDDPISPTLLAPSGDLVDTSRWHRGNEPVTFGATDNTGIKELAVYVDGSAAANKLARVTQTCDYSRPVPCQSLNASVYLDVDTLTDGAHEIRIAATDAAGNETGSDPAVTINVDHTAPGAPVLGVAPRATDDPGVSLGWSLPAEAQLAPLTEARWRACPAGSSTGCVGGSGAPTAPVAFSLPAPGAWTVSAWLVDAAGNQGAVASTTVRLTTGTSAELGTPVLPGSPAQPVTPVSVAKPGAALRLSRAALDRSARRLTVAGTLRTAISGRVRIVLSRKAGGKTVRRTVTARVNAGRYSAQIRVSRAEAAARKLVVEVTSPSDARYRTDTVRRTATRR